MLDRGVKIAAKEWAQPILKRVLFFTRIALTAFSWGSEFFSNCGVFHRVPAFHAANSAVDFEVETAKNSIFKLHPPASFVIVVSETLLRRICKKCCSFLHI